MNKNFFERFSQKVSDFSGSGTAFIIALCIVIAWVVTGPVFDYSDTWQLVINTGTTIVTFLMVFLIQRAQNKESKAMHLKLNELVAALEGASNRLIDVEDISETELEALRHYYRSLYRAAKKEGDMCHSRTVEDTLSDYDETKKPEITDNETERAL